MAGQAKNRALNRLPGTVKLEQNEAQSGQRSKVKIPTLTSQNQSEVGIGLFRDVRMGHPLQVAVSGTRRRNVLTAALGMSFDSIQQYRHLFDDLDVESL